MLRVTAALAAAMLVACGDNSRVCGPGTVEVDGTCTGSGGVCGDGTVLDQVTNTCVPDPSVCGDGTVLVRGKCVDPTGQLDVDILEGPEPNGFEPNATPAGLVTQLRGIGEKGIVIKGCITPVGDAADFDVYPITVSAPTLIKVTADGVNGLAAAFFAAGNPSDPLLKNYLRYGLNLATDMSRRELFLPAAGTYDLVISDSRTLLPVVTNGGDLPPAGNADGTSCYFVTIDQKAITTTQLDLAADNTGTIGEDLVFYTAPLPEGFISVTGAIDSPHAAASFDILNNNVLRQIDSPANALFAGIKQGDTPLIVLDYDFNYALTPVPYKVTVGAATSSQGLSTDGGVVNATSNGQSFGAFTDVNVFHWDVGAANNTDGMDIVFSKDVQGVIADQDGFIFANMSGLNVPTVGGVPAPNTFTSYLGLLNEKTPGRYYFVVFVPRDPVGTAFTVTSTIKPVAVLDSAPGGSVSGPVNQFNSNPIHYDAGTVPWQLFDATGNNTNGIHVRMFDRSVAVGRLDNLKIKSGPGAGTVPTCSLETDCFGNKTCVAGACVQKTDFFSPVIDFSGPKAFPDPGDPRGVILRNPNALTPAFATNLFVVVNPTIQLGANRTFEVDFATRDHENFGGPIAAGTTKSAANQTLDSGTPARRYFVETAPGNLVRLTATPVTAGMDVVIKLVNNDESVQRTIDDNGANGAESQRFAIAARGYVAFEVSANIPGTYNLDVVVDAPFYAVSNTSTAFADACAGGTQQTLTDKSGNGNDPKDEGLTGAIAAPAGFTFFGASVSNFVVSSNGFISFDTSATDASFGTTKLPDGVGEVNIAPLWDDLTGVTVCTKTVGGKLVVQWTGEEFSFSGTGDAVQFQAILDPTDSSIEYVYGPGQVADGFVAVSGVQTRAGDEATQIGAFTSFVAPNTSRKLHHP